MKLNKEIGYWNSKNSTMLDDVAYNFLVEKIEVEGYDHINQRYFMKYKTSYPYTKHYEKARFLLRFYKINKIIDGIG